MSMLDKIKTILSGLESEIQTVEMNPQASDITCCLLNAPGRDPTLTLTNLVSMTPSIKIYLRDTNYDALEERMNAIFNLLLIYNDEDFDSFQVEGDYNPLPIDKDRYCMYSTWRINYLK